MEHPLLTTVKPLAEFFARGLQIKQYNFMMYPDIIMMRIDSRSNMLTYEFNRNELPSGEIIVEKLVEVCSKVCMLDLIGKDIMTLPLDADHGNGD